MYVQVRHGLSGSRTIIDANVKTIRLEFGGKCYFGFTEQRHKRTALVIANIEKGTDVAPADNETMAR
jgi:hypothetical protein